MSYVNYVQISQEAVDQVFGRGSYAAPNDTTGTAKIRLRERKIGPDSHPKMVIILPNHGMVPQLKNGMPSATCTGVELCEAIFGFRIPEISQFMHRNLSKQTKVAFIKNATTTGMPVIELTYNPHEARYLLITEQCSSRWEVDFTKKDRQRLRDIIDVSLYAMFGEPVHIKGTVNDYRNFFLIPITYRCYSHNWHEFGVEEYNAEQQRTSEKYIAMAEAFFDGNPYIDAETIQDGVVSPNEADRMIAVLDRMEEEDRAKDAAYEEEPVAGKLLDEPENQLTVMGSDQVRLKTWCFEDDMFFKHTYVIMANGCLMAPSSPIADGKYLGCTHEWHEYLLDNDCLVVRIVADWSLGEAKLRILWEPDNMTDLERRRANFILHNFKEIYDKQYPRKKFAQRWEFKKHPLEEAMNLKQNLDLK